jgi:hypothetical protein
MGKVPMGMLYQVVVYVGSDDDKPLLKAFGDRPHRIEVLVKCRLFLPEKIEAVDHNEIGYVGIMFQERIERIHSSREQEANPSLARWLFSRWGDDLDGRMSRNPRLVNGLDCLQVAEQGRGDGLLHLERFPLLHARQQKRSDNPVAAGGWAKGICL